MNKSFTKFAMSSLAAAALVCSLSLPTPANAQARGARGAAQRIQSAQHQEASQIRQGVRNGSLTKAQGKDLANHMSQLQAKAAADRASGNLTPQEAQQLKSATKKEEKAINGAESNPGTMPPTKQ
jgi:hypothetical protein